MQATGEMVACKGTCGQELPATEEFFYKNGSGLHSKCKPCYGEFRREYREDRVEEKREYDGERRLDPELRAERNAYDREYGKTRRPKAPQRQRVYILEQAGLFKIGYTATFFKRLMAYHAQSALPFYLVGICDGDRQDESRLQRRFRKSCHHGEWFALSAAQLAEAQCEFMLSDSYVWFDEGERPDTADFRKRFDDEDELESSTASFITSITSTDGVTVDE